MTAAGQPMPPGPVPTQASVVVVDMANGSRQIMVSIFTPSGAHVTFWDSNQLAAFAAQLTASARQARFGLIIPTNGDSVNPR